MTAKDDTTALKPTVDPSERYRKLEIIFWVILCLLLSLSRIILGYLAPLFFENMQSTTIWHTLVFFYDYGLFVGLGLVFSLMVFLMIFQKLPFRLIRETAGLRQAFVIGVRAPFGIGTELDLPKRSDSSDLKSLDPNSLDPISLVSSYAASSDRLAQTLFTRAGVYLLVGVLVAATGLVVFYFRNNVAPLGSSSPPVADIDILKIWTSLLPNFGILFFIEFIAFFFLKQYRSAMDEFRYYESIKRRREETVVILKLLSNSEYKDRTMELISCSILYSGPSVLKTGETTEIIEARKLEKSELEILDKFTDLVSKLKAP